MKCKTPNCGYEAEPLSLFCKEHLKEREMRTETLRSINFSAPSASHKSDNINFYNNNTNDKNK